MNDEKLHILALIISRNIFMKALVTALLMLSTLSLFAQFKNMKEFKAEALKSAQQMDRMDGETSGIYLERKLLKSDKQIEEHSASALNIVFDICVNPMGRVVSAEYKPRDMDKFTKQDILKARKQILDLRFESDQDAAQKECALFEWSFEK